MPDLEKELSSYLYGYFLDGQKLKVKLVITIGKLSMLGYNLCALFIIISCILQQMIREGSDTKKNYFIFLR